MTKKVNKKILVTGGHFTAAVAVISELRKRGYNDFVWAGHKYTMLKDKEPSAEYKEITKMGIPFFSITAGKLYRYPSFIGIISFLRIPIGFIQSLFLIAKTKPDLVLSFGGYIALPVALSAFIFRIPVITHEQTTTVGLANKIIGKISKKVMLAWQESSEHFNAKKIIYTGNPVREVVFVNDKPFVDFNSQKGTILVMGGNQGSHDINMCIEESIPVLTQYYNIIHQCGSNSIFRDYEKLYGYTHKYPNYRVFKGIWGEDIGRAMNQAKVCITRSGANTVYEIALLKKPSVLIPLPYAVNNEQMKNAQFLEKNKCGVILPQDKMTPDSLLDAVHEAEKLQNDKLEDIVPTNASVKIADVIESF